MPRLSEVIEEGHKIPVFSQFTSFLAIIRLRLEREGVDYEYLDGKTRNRGVAVQRFQSDPRCKLFLISLKAGGQGLNLTAAEYVFLLDRSAGTLQLRRKQSIGRTALDTLGEYLRID